MRTFILLCLLPLIAEAQILKVVPMQGVPMQDMGQRSPNLVGVGPIFGMSYFSNKIFAVSVQTPTSLIRFNDVNDLRDFAKFTFPNDNKHKGAYYCKGSTNTGKIYVSFGSQFTSLQVSEVDPVTLDYTDVINDTGNRFASSLTPAGTNLFVGGLNWKGQAVIVRYSLATFASNGIVTFPAFSLGTDSLTYDGTNVYAGLRSPFMAAIAKLDPDTMAVVTTNVIIAGVKYSYANQDIGFSPTKVFLGGDGGGFTNIVIMDKSTMALSALNPDNSATAYLDTFFYDGSYLWVGKQYGIFRCDLDKNLVVGYSYPPEDVTWHGFTGDGTRLFVACAFPNSDNYLRRLAFGNVSTECTCSCKK